MAINNVSKYLVCNPTVGLSPRHYTIAVDPRLLIPLGNLFKCYEDIIASVAYIDDTRKNPEHSQTY